MKAERRHELKENVLSRKLRALPSFSQVYGTRIAVGVIVLLVIALGVQYHLRTNEDRLTRAQQDINVAEDDLRQLVGQLTSAKGEEQTIADRRKAFYEDGLQRAQDAFDAAPDKYPALKAQALILQGDMNFHMANLPDLTGAATQPSLGPDDSQDTLLTNAEDAYRKVLDQYSSQMLQSTAAHFGLAAVAEDRAGLPGANAGLQWDNAHDQYQAILQSDAPVAFEDLAKERTSQLDKFQKPLLVNVPSLTTQPSTQPTTAPATQP